ncbi:hypothetical protein [Actinoplanes sp. NPDC026619]|uniref:hypothetical protein n=1 Tax=Actinoplanes sp. NPDC026619 TaxID=3155798 RepID=UPI0033FEE9F2
MHLVHIEVRMAVFGSKRCMRRVSAQNSPSWFSRSRLIASIEMISWLRRASLSSSASCLATSGLAFVRRQGELAGRMLLSLLTGAATGDDITVPTRLVIRGSTAPPSRG